MTDDTLRETVKRAFHETERRYEELNGTSDRGAAILAVAHFEGKLLDAIMRRFATGNEEFAKLCDSGEKIFNEYDPIRNFTDKIEIGFALGLYSDEVRKDLRKIGQIRNKFAHESEPITFDDDYISKKCDGLRPSNASENLRENYIAYLKEIEDHLEYAKIERIVGS